MQGELHLNTNAITGSFESIVFNLVGSADLTISAAPVFAPMYLALSELTGSANIVAHGVTIFVPEAVNYYVGLNNASTGSSNERLNISFSAAPDGTFTIDRNVLAGFTVRLEPNDAIIPDENGIEETIPVP